MTSALLNSMFLSYNTNCISPEGVHIMFSIISQKAILSMENLKGSMENLCGPPNNMADRLEVRLTLDLHKLESFRSRGADQ